uniref:Uncharacterized protein n=1 Tax=Siphoviridae sp. ctt0c4 TaxID=2825702 RepID=A0A8S5V3I4_9CAUD|nr:MAG TPA: hypothetical protein [Siphoviridae sp. ctt0c4]
MMPISPGWRKIGDTAIVSIGCSSSNVWKRRSAGCARRLARERDRFGVKLLEKGDTGDYVIARMENGVTMQKIILSPLEARLLASEILSKVKPIKRKKKSWNVK